MVQLVSFASDPTTGQFGSIAYNLFMARLVGIPLIGPFGMGYKMYSFCLISLYSVMYTGFELYDLIYRAEDLNAFTQNACLTITHVGGVLKLINVFLKYGEICFMLEKLKTITQRYCVLQNQKLEFIRGEIINKRLLTIYLFIVSFTAFIAIGLLVFSVDPNKYIGQKFPFRVSLPDVVPRSLQIAYVSSAVTINALQIVCMDYLHINIINQVRFHLRMLNICFAEIDHVADPAEALKTQIKHHNEILSLRHTVESIYSFPLLVQFFTSLLIFALAGFQATVRSDLSGTMMTFLYCGCIFTELFFFCWFGNEVIEQNKTVSAMGYNSKWYDFDRTYKKSLLIFLMNAQQPFVLTAGGFVSLSLDTFSTILSRSYSFITLLRQFNGK